MVSYSFIFIFIYFFKSSSLSKTYRRRPETRNFIRSRSYSTYSTSTSVLGYIFQAGSRLIPSVWRSLYVYKKQWWWENTPAPHFPTKTPLIRHTIMPPCNADQLRIHHSSFRCLRVHRENHSVRRSTTHALAQSTRVSSRTAVNGITGVCSHCVPPWPTNWCTPLPC